MHLKGSDCDGILRTPETRRNLRERVYRRGAVPLEHRGEFLSRALIAGVQKQHGNELQFLRLERRSLSFARVIINFTPEHATEIAAKTTKGYSRAPHNVKQAAHAQIQLAGTPPATHVEWSLSCYSQSS